MTKRAERGQRTQAENGATAELAHLVEPMLTGITTTHDHLLAWVHAQGLAALDELFRGEAVILAGPKGRHQDQRTQIIIGARRRRSSPSAAGGCKYAGPACARRPARKPPCRRWRPFGAETR